MQHTHAENLVEAVVCKGELVNLGLGQLEALAIVSVTARVTINSTIIVSAVQNDGGGAQKNLTKTICTTAHLEQRTVAEQLRIPASFGIKALLAKIRARMHI